MWHPGWEGHFPEDRYRQTFSVGASIVNVFGFVSYKVFAPLFSSTVGM